MRRVAQYAVMAVLAGALTVSTTAQDWSATLMVDPFPSPYLSDWQQDPTLASLEIVNSGPKRDVVIVDAEIIAPDGERYLAHSKRLLVEPNLPVLIQSTDLTDWTVEGLSASARDRVRRTGLIPEGSGYQVCIEVRNLWDQILVSGVCAFFTIAHPDPPQLVYPLDSVEVYTPFPLLQWIPPTVAGGKQVIYSLRVAEILPGQTPRVAIRGNVPQYENNALLMSSIEYPPDALPLEEGGRYAWQVQALDAAGRAITRNEGRSEVGQFVYAGSPLGLPELSLIAPQNNAVVVATPLELEWNAPATTVEGDVYYTLRLAAIRTGQTPAEAIAHNVPHFVNNETVTATRFTYPESAPAFDEGQAYAWQVEARDQYGNPVADNNGRSPVRAFTFAASATVAAEDLVLPERIPLPTEEIAYLELRADGRRYVDYTFSADSSQLIITSPHVGAVPLVVPALRGAAGQAPRVGAAVNLTIDRYSTTLESGTITAAPSASGDSPFALERLGIPVALSRIEYRPSSRMLVLSGNLMLFGEPLSSLPVGMTIGEDGVLSQTVSSRATGERISLVSGSDRLAYDVDRVDGAIEAALLGGANTTRLTFGGHIAFLPDEPDADTRRFGLDVVSDAAGVRVGWQENTDGAWGLELGVGSMALDLRNLSCATLLYTPATGTIDFDFVCNLGITLNDFSPAIELPPVPAVHLTNDGFVLPQFSIPNLPGAGFSGYRTVQVRPYACRMAARTFDWFGWDGGDVGDWGLRFDLGVRFPGLPPHLGALATHIENSPLSVLDASYRNGRFHGGIEPRRLPAPLRVGLADSSAWQLDIGMLAGVFSDTLDEQHIALTLGADLVPPAADSVSASVPLGDSAVTMSPDGILTATAGPFGLQTPLPWGGSRIDASEATLVLDSAEGAQRAALRIDGAVEIAAADGPLRAQGRGVLDIIDNRFTEARFRTDDPVGVSVPADNQPMLGVRSDGGATVEPDGLVLDDGDGAILLESGRIPATLSGDVAFGLPSLTLDSGRVAFDGPFALRVENLNGGAGLHWRAVAGDASLLTDRDNLLLRATETATIVNGLLHLNDTASADIRLNETDYPNLRAVYADVAIAVNEPRVVSGRISLSLDGTEVAHLDSSGFWPGDHFAAATAEVLPMPDTAIAYVRTKRSDGALVVRNEPAGEHVRLFTPEGTTADMVVPALAYGGDAPTVPITLDLVVNPVTLAPVSGTMEVAANDGGALFSLLSRGVALEVTRLAYAARDGRYGLAADVRAILPRALRDAALAAQNVAIDASGLSSFDNGVSTRHRSDPPRAQVDLAGGISVAFDGLRGNLAAGTDSLYVSGDVYAELFTSADALTPTPLHFHGPLTTRGIDAAIGEDNLTGGAVPVGQGLLEPTDAGNDAPLALQAAMDDTTMSVTMARALFSMPSLNDDFALTLSGLRLSPSGLTIADSVFTGEQRQHTRLFGFGLRVDELSVSTPSADELAIALDGRMGVFGGRVDVRELEISTRDGLTGGSVRGGAMVLADSMLIVDSLAIGRDALRIRGALNPPRPFSGAGHNQLALRIAPSGDWLDSSGAPLAVKHVAAVSEEISGSDVHLGTNPMQIIGRLAELTLIMHGDNEECRGEIATTVNTYWPGGDDDSASIVITGGVSFTDSQATLDPWQVSGSSAALLSFAGLIDLSVNSVSVPDTNEFQLCVGGQLTLGIEGITASGGCQFSNFVLREDDFTFGRVQEGSVDLGLIALEVTDFAYGKDLTDLQTYDIEFGSGMMQADSTTKSIPGFYVTFGGSIGSDLLGFEGGIDRLLVYKSPNNFHLLIDNARFSYSDVVDGRLDLIADVPLQLDDFQFKFLIGGRLTVSGAGFAAVGELSYTETSLAGSTFKAPGFGIFLAAMGLDIKLLPLPITIEDVGGGIFFNPSPEVEEFVRGAVGLENSAENGEFFSALNDYKARFEGVMTFMEVYVYGAISIPDDKMLKGRSLLTMATDKYRIDAQFTVVGDSAMKKVCELGATGFLEIGVPQDFSSYPYAAGNITVTAKSKSPADSSLDFMEFPTLASATATFEFFVAGAEAWALHGSMSTELFRVLESNFEIFLGPPGFLVRGSIERTFDAVVVTVDVGLEASIWYKWAAPSYWGGYGRAWVEAAVLSEAFAGVRGELGIALVKEIDVYFYGYAELTAWFLGSEWSKCVWVQWRDGEVSGGVGGDSRLIEIIEQSNQLADEILGEVASVQQAMTQIRRDAFAQLTEAQIRAIVESLQNGQSAFYRETLLEDADETILALRRAEANASTQRFERQYRTAKEGLARYRDALSEVFADRKADELTAILTAWNETVGGLDDALEQRLSRYDSLFAALQQEIERNARMLDSVAVFSDAEDLRLENPLTVETVPVEGMPTTSMTFSIDETVQQRNGERARRAQESFSIWLEQVAQRAARVDSLRTGLFAALGPDGRISAGQHSFGDPLLTDDIVASSLLSSTSEVYRFYADRHEELQDKWFYTTNDGGTASLRNAFTMARWTSDEHEQNAFDRRLDALEQLAGSDIPVDLSVYDKSIAVDKLGEGFYRDVPRAYLSFVRLQLDSLYTHLATAHASGISSRDEIHRTFSARTDALWNRYAEVSENLYEMYDMYLDELRLHERLGVEDLPMSIEHVRARADELAEEFTMTGAGSFSATVDEAAGRYLPTTVRLDYGGGPSLVEYAYAISEPEETASAVQFQSVGARDRIELRFHPMPAVDQPFARDLTIRTRVRNKAGYAVEGHSADVTIRNRDPLNDEPLTRISTDGPQSLAGITGVDFPDYPSVNPGPNNGGVVYYSGDPGRVRVAWDFETFFGGTSPFADMQCAVFRADRPNRVIGEWRSVGTMTSAEIDGLNLRANTGDAYIVKVRGKDANGAVQSVATSPPLYIDRSPPRLPRNMTVSFETLQRANRVVMTCSQARELIADDDMSGYAVNLPGMSSYQYKVWLDGADTTGLAWQPMSRRPYSTYTDDWYETSAVMHLDIGTTPMRGDARVAIRARNTNPRCNNGFGPTRVIEVPRQDDYTPAHAGRFEVAGLDSTGKLLVRVIETASDSESGIAGYQYRVTLQRSNDIIRPFPSSTGSFDVAGSTVSAGDTLHLALGRRPNQVRGAWLRIDIRGLNPTGQGSAASLTYCVPPATPRLEATVTTVSQTGGQPRFRVACQIASGASHAQSYTMALRVGTRPGARDLNHTDLRFGPGYQDLIETGATLPDSISYGRTVYVSVAGVSRMLDGVRVSSDTVTVELRTPDGPVLEGVTQDDRGRLQLRIAQAAFGGRHSATYRYEIRNDDNDEVLRPFPAEGQAPDFTSDRVRAGTRLSLSENASDMSPAIVVALRADGAGGATRTDTVHYRPMPAKPRVTADVSRQRGGRCVLRLNGAFDTRLMRQAGASGSIPELGYALHSESGGVDSIDHGWTYPTTRGGGQDETLVFLNDSVSAHGRLVLQLVARSAYRRESDTALMVLEMPKPRIFDEIAATRDGNLAVRIVSNGFARDVSVAGYQYAVCVNDDAATPVRPWPGSPTDYDFAPHQVRPGERLVLPVEMSAMPRRTIVVVSLRGVADNGDTTSQSEGYLSLPPLPLSAAIVHAGEPGRYALHASGTVEQRSSLGQQLTVAFALGATPDAADVLSGTIAVGADGTYNARYELPHAVTVGQRYFFSTHYTVNGKQSVGFTDTLAPPCEPMFSRVRQRGDEALVVDIEQSGFNGARDVAGYQWALGSEPGRYDIRPFPADGNYDFATGDVREGATVTLDRSIVGLPALVYVSLKAVNERGVADITTQAYRPSPTMPVATPLSLRPAFDERNNYLRWELDRSSVDTKCEVISMSVRTASRSIVAKNGYGYPTWEWSYYHQDDGDNPVFECPVSKMVTTRTDWHIEVVAMDRSRTRRSREYRVTFNLDGNLNAINVRTTEVP